MTITQKKIEIKNKRAEHDYFILDTYNAGIVLCGTEIKSIRSGKAGLTDSFCYIKDGEIWAKNVYIAEYFYGSFYNHEAKRDRKLLLNRREINRLAQETKNPDNSVDVVYRRKQPRKNENRFGSRQKGIRQTANAERKRR